MVQKILFCIFVVSAIVLFYAYAGEVKLTTYYPAPYGEYKRVIAKTLGVGTTTAPDPATNTGDAWIAGNVGIGTTTPAWPLVVRKEYSAPTMATALGSILSYTQYNTAMPVGILYTGAELESTAAHTTGDIRTLDGAHIFAHRIGAGTVNNLRGLYVRVDNFNATGAVTNGVGVYIATSAKIGTITNDYGIYQEDTEAKNYFGGNVGIGTTSPGNPLTVKGGSSQVLIEAAAAGDDAVIFFDPRTNAGAVHDTAKIRADAATGSGTATLNCDIIQTDNSGWDTVMTLKSGGNVGIGTTSPAETLEVAGKVKIGAYTLPNTDGTNSQTLVTNGSGTVTWGNVGGGGGGVTGSYTGTGAGKEQTISIGFQPRLIQICPKLDYKITKIASMTTWGAHYFSDIYNCVKIESTGFSVKGTQANTLNRIYYYWAE